MCTQNLMSAMEFTQLLNNVIHVFMKALPVIMTVRILASFNSRITSVVSAFSLFCITINPINVKSFSTSFLERKNKTYFLSPRRNLFQLRICSVVVAVVKFNPLSTTGLLTQFLIGSYHELFTYFTNHYQALKM